MSFTNNNKLDNLYSNFNDNDNEDNIYKIDF
jgi:hypothetical protein